MDCIPVEFSRSLSDYCPMETKPTQNRIRVHVVDDHTLFTTVLANILNDSEHFVAAGTSNDAESALVALRAAPVDVLLLDLQLPRMSGIELLQVVQQESLAGRTVVCSGVTTDEAIEAAFAAGAHCFVEKTSGIADLLETLRRVAQGETPLSERAAGVLRQMARRRSGLKPLAEQDIAILRRLAMPMSPSQIATELGLSLSGVYKARRRIRARTGAIDDRVLFAMAAQLGLAGTGVEPRWSVGTSAPQNDPVVAPSRSLSGPSVTGGAD